MPDKLLMNVNKQPDSIKKLLTSFLVLIAITTLKPKDTFTVSCQKVIGWSRCHGEQIEKVEFLAESVSKSGMVHIINDTIAFHGPCCGRKNGRIFLIGD